MEPDGGGVNSEPAGHARRAETNRNLSYSSRGGGAVRKVLSLTYIVKHFRTERLPSKNNLLKWKWSLGRVSSS